MKFFATLLTGLGIGLGAWVLRSAFVSVSPGVAKLDPLIASPKNPERHRWARPIVRNALKSILGREPSIAELQYGQSVGWLESSYGSGWGKCPCPGGEGCDVAAAKASNNWGAVQSRDGSGFDWCDTHPDGSTYRQKFRMYPTPEAGAADKLRLMFKNMRAVADSLSMSGATAYRASLAMRRSSYYGGWCPNAIKEHGKDANKYGDPKGDPKALACEAEAVAMHAKRAKSIIDDIAAANGDPGALPLGTLDDALSWWESRKGKA